VRDLEGLRLRVKVLATSKTILVIAWSMLRFTAQHSYIYIYIYRERERERERESSLSLSQFRIQEDSAISI
jgi:hypothetical protein